MKIYPNQMRLIIAAIGFMFLSSCSASVKIGKSSAKAKVETHNNVIQKYIKV